MRPPFLWFAGLLLVAHIRSSACFGIPSELHAHLPALVDSASLHIASSPQAGLVVRYYQEALRTDPLKTQVTTGVVLAVLGDAIAQKSQSRAGDNEQEYDVKRATSFATFDAVYRVVQHYLYPPMIALCQGNVLGPLFASKAAAMEQALVSQLLIIPIVYYPVFFAVTGMLQGLTVQDTIQRAKSTFWPLMKRNWLFWIPVQFGVFSFVQDEAAQISILIACGLVWTMILSVSAGAAKDATDGDVAHMFPEDEMRCVASMAAGAGSPSIPDWAEETTITKTKQPALYARRNNTMLESTAALRSSAEEVRR